MAKSVHSGHRDRVRDEFLFKGISESTPPHKVVEYILFHSIPQRTQMKPRTRFWNASDRYPAYSTHLRSSLCR